MVYGLGSRGATLFEQRRGDDSCKLRWSEKNRSVGRIFLEHALFVSDIMVTLELSCRNSTRMRLVSPEELSNGKRAAPFRWKVTIDKRFKLGVIPDRVFAFDVENGSGSRNRVFFFLEADRGTMPVKRRTLSQTSFFRKLLAYEATWSQGHHRSLFGFNRFRVMTVTSSPERMKSLVKACSQLDRGHGLFLFFNRGDFENTADISSKVWVSGKGEASELF